MEYSELGKLGVNNWKRFALSIMVFLFFMLLTAIISGMIDYFNDYSDIYKGYLFYATQSLLFLLAIIISVKIVHKRKMISLINPYDKILWNRVFWGFGIYLIFNILSMLMEYLIHPSDFGFVFDLHGFLKTLPILILILPIQTTAEELFFRGYIMQSFGLIIRNHTILAIISGFMFLLPHLLNSEVKDSSYRLIIFYFFIGYFLAYITLKTKSLEFSIGMHTANNFFCFALINYENSALQTYPVFIISKPMWTLEIIQFTVMAIIIYYMTNKYVRGKQGNIEIPHQANI